jgi:hypothetical protein
VRKSMILAVYFINKVTRIPQTRFQVPVTPSERRMEETSILEWCFKSSLQGLCVLESRRLEIYKFILKQSYGR